MNLIKGYLSKTNNVNTSALQNKMHCKDFHKQKKGIVSVSRMYWKKMNIYSELLPKDFQSALWNIIE